MTTVATYFGLQKSQDLALLDLSASTYFSVQLEGQNSDDLIGQLVINFLSNEDNSSQRAGDIADINQSRQGSHMRQSTQQTIYNIAGTQ